MLQPLRWRCVECVIRHERDVREEQHHIYVARTSNDIYCCLLPQCEALRTCRSAFSGRNSNISIGHFRKKIATHVRSVKLKLGSVRP